MEQWPGFAVNDPLFVDGSADPSVFPELCSAAWAVVQLVEGKLTAALLGLVPPSHPRTAPAAEQWALYVAAVVRALCAQVRSHSPSPANSIWSDRLSVCKGYWGGPARAASGKLFYGGLGLATFAAGGFPYAASCQKVKAHQDLKAVPEEDRWLAVGNDMADQMAKDALARSAVQPADEIRRLRWLEAVALATARIAAVVAPLWGLWSAQAEQMIRDGPGKATRLLRSKDAAPLPARGFRAASRA